MNANELADLLADSNDPDIRRAVAMLRQQQAEIEALKELLDNEGIVVGHDYLNNCIATMRKAQEK